ncbi:MAG: T9SS type A sorting domain-containing protein [Ferruginibacter sp.]
MMKRIFLLILILASFYNVQAQVQVSYYVVGDADDWQLFMSKSVSDNLAAGGKVVLITLTAGDEGNGNTTFNGSSIPYYLAKERGAVYSSKFFGDFYNLTSPNNNYLMPSAQPTVVNGKNMIKYVYGNSSGNGAVVNYFLRLPDGGPSGTGYPGTGNKSLQKLKVNGTPITSIDGTATYNSWAELAYTIYTIIFTEKGLDLQVYLNTSSLNTVTNPNDYPDHFYSSTAAQDGVATRLWVGINEYVMDYSSNLTANLSNEEYESSAGAFTMYNWSLVKDKYPSKLTNTVRAWFPMEYSSVKRSPSGNAPLPITLLDFTGTLKGNNVLLEWSTTAEINSKEFKIEKSSDGITYRKLNTVPAAGNSSILKKYNYLDIEATELNYYRLKMIDIDDFTKQSNIVIVKNAGLSQAVSVVNNPFKDYINIRFAKIPKGGVTLRLIDLSGKIISTNEVYNPLSSVIRFDYNKTLSKGVYVLQVGNEGKQYSIKVLKE